MSNFHEFGSGKVCMRCGTFDGKLVVALTDLEESRDMDVEYPAPHSDGIPVHSTVMTFPDKRAAERLISFLQAAVDGWEG